MKKKKQSSRLPSISIILATYNSSATIFECMESLKLQEYTADIELIIVDGGSSDDTLNIIKSFKKSLNIRLFTIDPKIQEAEYNKGVGVSKAKNDVILFIDHDNVLPHTKWLKKMVKPLVEDETISGVEVLKFAYRKSDLLLDRYFALLGGVDPVPYYLGKDARLSWAEDTYNLRGQAEHKGTYYRVTFLNDKIPTLGANGALLQRKLLVHAIADPDNFFHIDINLDLIRKGHNTYAFVIDEIIHLKHTKLSDFIAFLWRRKYIVERQYFDSLARRRYAVYIPGVDTLGLIKYIVYTITIVKPLYDSYRGYRKVRDIAWFAHPVVCIAFLLVYGIAVVKVTLGKQSA